MAKSASDIVSRALTLLDEKLTTFNTVATTEMSLSEMGLEVLPEVCRNLVKTLPYELKRYLATTATLTQETLTGGESQVGYVKKKVAFVAPTDFWELVAIRLSVWSNPVTNYILPDNPDYNKQNNPFTRAGRQNPVVVVTNNATSTAARIECFSVHNNDAVSVSHFSYISFDNVPDDLGNNWPDELFELVTTALANQLMVIKNRMEQAKVIGSEGEKIIEQHK
jgi:hypothetical protein